MKSHSLSEYFYLIFKNKDGKVVIWQRPNLVLYGWIVCTFAVHAITSVHYKIATQSLGTAFLFVWAYMEVTTGVNYFRKLLGSVVLGLIVVGYFR